MSAWKRLFPIPVDPALLPTEWEIIHDPKLDHYAVVGRCGSQHPDTEHIEVVLRIDFARAPDGTDIRHMVGTAIARGMTTVVNRYRARQAEQRQGNGSPYEGGAIDHDDA